MPDNGKPDGDDRGQDARGARKRGGSQPTYSRAADGKLYDEWQAAKGKGGLTMKEFAESKGRPYVEVKRTIDRERKRWN